MHSVQKKILKIDKTQDVLSLGIRPLGRKIEVEKPQIVKHHLIQLQKKGLIKTKSPENIRHFLQHSSKLQPSFVKIPVLGAANCGPATLIANENTEEYITVSQSFLRKRGNIFALVAKGDSMNRARVNGNTSIENNDYVIIDSDQRTPIAGNYILSVIDDEANIKKYARSKDGSIVLLSESTRKYAPIHISKEDRFIINGKVIQIIKREVLN